MTQSRRPEVSDLVEIGRGGFGVVYRARQEQFRRDVALKVITATLDDRSRARFMQECRALGQLSGHPHIVSVYDGGIDPDGQAFLVMPFYGHGSLAQRLRRHGPMDWREVLDLGVRLAGALQTAHDSGILHRDIKPGNVLIDEYGGPRLADFGQARFADTELTRSGDITATPAFAAPEVLQGQQATVAADVYSLAATLMALVLGRAPFDGVADESVAPVIYRVLSEPPPDLRRGGVPEPATGVLERAMAKDPARRFDTAAELGMALQHAQHTLGLPVSPLAIPGRPALAASGGSETVRVAGAAVGPGRVRTSPLHWLAPRTAVGPPAEPGWSAQSPKPKRRWGRIAVALVLVAALAVGGFFVVRVLNEPEPAQDLVARDLLLGPSQLPGGGWALNTEAEGTLNPIVRGDGDLLECLGLPVRGEDDDDTEDDLEVRDLDLSSVYTARDTFVQTGGAIDSEPAALALVEAFRSPGFDLCVDQAESFATGLQSTDDRVDYDQQLRYTEPDLPELPDLVDASTRRIVVPLTEGGGDAYVIDYVLVGVGPAVAFAGFFQYGDPVDDDVRFAVIETLVDELTE